jgi:hypothetical protein
VLPRLAPPQIAPVKRHSDPMLPKARQAPESSPFRMEVDREVDPEVEPCETDRAEMSSLRGGGTTACPSRPSRQEALGSDASESAASARVITLQDGSGRGISRPRSQEGWRAPREVDPEVEPCETDRAEMSSLRGGGTTACPSVRVPFFSRRAFDKDNTPVAIASEP